MRRVGVPVVLVAALVFASPSEPRTVTDGGTFRVAAVEFGLVGPIDPGIVGVDIDLLRPACGSLMAYPNERLPAGLRLAPELAVADPVVSNSGRTYRFEIRKNARFSTGAPVLARDLVHSLERVLTPSLQSGISGFFQDVVGAAEMQAGTAKVLRGAVARGRTLTLKLTKPVPDLPARMTELCAVPASLPVDPEGAKAPIPSAAPYYVAQLSPEQLVLERNRFYAGRRPHHVDRITADLTTEPNAAVDDVASGKADYVWPPTPELNARLPELARRYGLNRSQFFLQPSLAGRMFFLNTSRPLFRDNVKLRQAVNFAVDRRALVREFGPYAATSTDQFLPPLIPGFRNERIYPLTGPDLRKARALASGNTRGGKAVVYVRTTPEDVAAGQVLRRNLKKIGLEVVVKEFPVSVLFQKAQTPGERYDLILLGWVASYKDPREFLGIFDGRNPNNYSRFNSPKFNELLDRAARLSGRKRYRAYGELDVQLARAAPAVPYAVYKVWSFVSKNAGCIVMNPALDLTAVCLK